MIQSFACKRTAALFAGTACYKDWRSFQNVAERKLLMLDNAVTLTDLKSPPQNKLEKLTKDRAGQHAIRINDQYRLCFVWTAQGPANVEIVDYH